MRQTRVPVFAAIAGLTIGLAATLTLATDVVVLRSGTTMEGTVVSLDDHEIVLEIEGGKSILDRDDVRSIHFDTTASQLATDDEDHPGDEDDDDRDGPVFRIGDKKTLDVGDAIETNRLRVRLTSVDVERVRVVDLFGKTSQSRAPYLVLTFEVWNIDNRKSLTVQGNPVFGEKLVRLETGAGDEVEAHGFGAGSAVDGALRDADTIGPGDREGHLEVFEIPGDDDESLELRLDLTRFGDAGVVRWRIEDWD